MSDWAASASTESLILRARIIRCLREFLDARGLIEVSTPVLTDCGITDVQIDSVATADPPGFLRTSPEYAHKRLLASGLGDLYELGPVFRAGETGQMHRIEFTLLEWYRRAMTWRDLAEETLTLCQSALQSADQGRWKTQWMDWSECFLRHGLPDPLSADTSELEALTRELPEDCDRDMRLDWLFSTAIQSEFPDRTLTVVHGYPASQAALARLDDTDPRKAQRFEVFAGSVELANGYQELTDAREQARRFEHDNRKRAVLGRRTMPVDSAFLAALAHGLPDCAGVALGVDRLLMVALNTDDIAQVRSF